MSIRCGVIGDPIAHSRSPEIHRHFADQFGLEFDYQRIHTPVDLLDDTVRTFFSAGGTGLNVTLPHKQAVMNLCDEVAASAQRAGSVNTLHQTPSALVGISTDGPGLVADLKRLGAPLTDARIVLIGAGGAARGVVEPLLAEKPRELVWSHRNPVKLEDPVRTFRNLGPLRACANMALKGDQFDLVIHATAAGHLGEVPLLPSRLFADNSWAYDLSYGAAAQPFLQWARDQGARHSTEGFGMLIEQAALSFHLWTGRHPDTSALHAAGHTI